MSFSRCLGERSGGGGRSGSDFRSRNGGRQGSGQFGEITRVTDFSEPTLRPQHSVGCPARDLSPFRFQRFTFPVASRQLEIAFSMQLVLRKVTLSVEPTSRAWRTQQVFSSRPKSHPDPTGRRILMRRFSLARRVRGLYSHLTGFLGGA